MIFSYSVPSKVILFGEHAAIYGFPSVATAVDLRMFLKCNLYESKSESEIRITYNNDKFNFNPFSIAPENENSTFKMYRKAFNNNFPPNHILKMKFTFNGPDSSGLGSSAALCTLVAATVQHIINNGNIDIKNLISQAIELEKFYHSKSSGIDVNTVIKGSSIIIQNGEISNFSLPKIPFLIVDSGVRRQAKVALDHVSDLLQKDKENALFKLKSLGKIADDFYQSKEKSDLKEFFTSSQNLLNSLGLSCPQVDEIIQKAKENKLYAKMTGAGMGGVVLVTGNGLNQKLNIFEPYKTFIVHPDSEGFRKEIPFD
ncbi:mevalonate kinase activity protein [Tritrichomonas musculus]|uniref:Mevalonate kinase n=1 Tax=Tritrichomonas musculus TaxID=1915356 RepID=A0ABR2ICP2_9EUKA